MIRCGTDIVEIRRIEDGITKEGSRFLNRIFTETEISYCEASEKHKFEKYAVRFAAKEAVFKAISEFLDNKYDIGWKNIEISNLESGKPVVNLVNIEFSKKMNIDISLSHEREYALAFVVIMEI